VTTTQIPERAAHDARHLTLHSTPCLCPYHIILFLFFFFIQAPTKQPFLELFKTTCDSSSKPQD